MKAKSPSFTAIKKKSETHISLMNNKKLKLISSSSIRNSSFDNSNINKLVIKHSNLTESNFRKCNLVSASIDHSDLSEADFTWSNLKGNKIYRANFKGSYEKSSNI